MRVAILGTGALGGVIAGCLADTGAELVCVSRGGTAEILQSGLTIFTPEGTVEMIPGDRYSVVDSEEGPLNEDMCNTCLLYTSPSPRDRTRSRMPSSA